MSTDVVDPRNDPHFKHLVQIVSVPSEMIEASNAALLAIHLRGGGTISTFMSIGYADERVVARYGAALHAIVAHVEALLYSEVYTCEDVIATLATLNPDSEVSDGLGSGEEIIWPAFTVVNTAMRSVAAFAAAAFKVALHGLDHLPYTPFCSLPNDEDIVVAVEVKALAAWIAQKLRIDTTKYQLYS